MKRGVFLVIKAGFLKNVVCIVVCISLVVITLNSGQAVGDAVNNAFGNAVDYRGESDNNGVIQPQIQTDAPEKEITGFGGGGYQTVNAGSTPTDIAILKKQAHQQYKNYKKTGDIAEKKMLATSKTLSYGNILLDNKTDVTVNLKKYLGETPNYKKITKDEPYILIYHSHTTEGYELLDLGWYSDSYNSRTKDKAKNMVRVGDALAESLEKQGFKVIHDKNIYDESYTGAYKRSRKSVESYLKKYPSIQITLDVHRDAIHYDNKVRCKPTAVINGKKAAQVMIITGCEGGNVESFPSWKQNLTFTLNLQNNIEKKYKSLMRPVYFSYRQYNMDVTPCSVLLEFGTDANTLEEAIYSAELVGNSLAEMLNNEMKKK